MLYDCKLQKKEIILFCVLFSRSVKAQFWHGFFIYFITNTASSAASHITECRRLKQFNPGFYSFGTDCQTL
jgi:hypothetical protein